MELKEMIKIMQHYENGGEVELKEKDNDDAEWEICYPGWNWKNFDYRIRATKQEVTIEDEFEFLLQDIVIGKSEYNDVFKRFINLIKKNCIYTDKNGNTIVITEVYYSDLMPYEILYKNIKDGKISNKTFSMSPNDFYHSMGFK